LCAGGALGGSTILGAAALFALAFAAKMVMVSGVVATVVWLWVTSRRPAAVRLAGASLLGMALVLLVMSLASGGVVFDVLRASSPGGATLGDIIRAPLTLARQARRVPETLAFIQLGCAAALVLLLRPRPLASLPLLLFASVLAITTVIFG